MKYFQNMRIECFLHFWLSKNVKFYINDLGTSASVMCFISDAPAMCSKIYEKKKCLILWTNTSKGVIKLLQKDNQNEIHNKHKSSCRSRGCPKP